LTLEQIATMIQEQNRPVQKPDVVVTLDAATKLLYELENETKEKVESSNQPSNMESQNTPEESSEKANE